MQKMLKTAIMITALIQMLNANSALEFDGVDDYVQLTEILPVAGTSNTVEAWIKIPITGTGNLEASERVGIILGNFDSNDNAGWEVHDDGQIRIWWNGEEQVYGSTDLRDNSWHHVAFVRDKSNDRLRGYVDGVLEFDHSGCGTDLTFDTPHRIGRDNRSSGSPHFHGSIDELRVWNTARTQEEIREYMCADVSGQSGLVAYYRMTDGSGTTLSDDAGMNSGTLYNMDNSDWVRDNQVPEGDGSTIPYRINGLNQLYWLSQNSAVWGSDHEQIADINAAATADWHGGAGFSTIGTNANNFLGSYDGAGYTISGLTVNRPSENYTGFIGQLDGGPVSDLGMVDVSMTGAHSTGGLAGYVESGNVVNCYVSGSVSGTDYVGGLSGQTANGTISQSYSVASVQGSGDHAGGLIGLLGSSIQNCYARGSVAGNTNVGGLVGSAFGGSTIDNSYSAGAVTGSASTGGLAGYAADENLEEGMPGASVTASFWDTESSGQSGSAAGTGKTTSEMKSAATFEAAGWDLAGESANGTEDYWDLDTGGEINAGYPFLDWENGTETALPVELADFGAEARQGKVVVTWRTESETENAAFRIYRDGVMIGELEGAGTTSEPQNYHYTDNYVIPGKTYTYDLADISIANAEYRHTDMAVTITAAEGNTGRDFSIGAACPNPFNPLTVVPLNLAKEAAVHAQLFDLTGRPVSMLHNGPLTAGSHALRIDGANLSTGIYFVHININNARRVQKIVLMK
ncbi:MAG: LamG-like jellyroll fold domain-containing protein [Fidelibacterota bacterium]